MNLHHLATAEHRYMLMLRQTRGSVLQHDHCCRLLHKTFAVFVSIAFKWVE
jgi:hypothetical protein